MGETRGDTKKIMNNRAYPSTIEVVIVVFEADENERYTIT